MVETEGGRKRRFFRTSKLGRCIIALLMLLLVVVLADRVWYAHIRSGQEKLHVAGSSMGMTKQEVRARAGEPDEKHNSVWIYRYRQPMCQHGSPLVQFLLFGHVTLEYKGVTLTFSEDGTVSRISSSGGSSGYLPRDFWLLFE